MCCIHSECPRVDVYAVAPGQVRHQRPLLRVARALWLAGQSTIKKRNGAEAKPAMDAHKVQMMTVERKRPLVMPPGSELGEEQALPDVNLAMFLRLAAKFNLYAVSLEEVKQRLMRRLSPALQMPKSQMDPYQINLRIEGPWPIQAFQQMLSSWALLANAVKQSGTTRWMWFLAMDQPVVLGKTFPMDDHPSGHFLAKLFRPKTAVAARAVTFMYTPAFLMLVDRPDRSQYLWLRCNVSTLGEQGSMDYTKPKKLPKLMAPKDRRWEEAYMAMRWSGYEEKDLMLMRSIGKLCLRLFKQLKPLLTMTDLLTSVMSGAVPHLQQAAAAPAAAAPATAAPASAKSEMEMEMVEAAPHEVAQPDSSGPIHRAHPSLDEELFSL